MKLLESRPHRQAYDFSEKKFKFDSMETIFQSLFYLCRLLELDPKLVNISFPDIDDDEEGTFLCYLWPFGDESDPILLPDMIEIKTHIVYNQKDAAKFCEISDRSLQRWAKESGLKPIKLGKQRVFKETDLTALAERKTIEKLSRTRINLDLENL